MTNAEVFRNDFGFYATELWAMTEAEFLEWLNADCDREKPNAVSVVRCKDCVYRVGSTCDYSAVYVRPNGYCQWGRREEGGKRDNS